MSDLDEEDVCDVGYEPPYTLKCPCVKLSGKRCDGVFRFDITNAHGAFLLCNKCGCCAFAENAPPDPENPQP